MEVQSNGVGGILLYNTTGDTSGTSVEPSLALRPIITIPLSSVTVEETADGKINLSY